MSELGFRRIPYLLVPAEALILLSTFQDLFKLKVKILL